MISSMKTRDSPSGLRELSHAENCRRVKPLVVTSSAQSLNRARHYSPIWFSFFDYATCCCVCSPPPPPPLSYVTIICWNGYLTFWCCCGCCCCCCCCFVFFVFFFLIGEFCFILFLINQEVLIKLHSWMQNFCLFWKKKYFFYFVHSFLQNIYISLSILPSILFK